MGLKSFWKKWNEMHRQAVEAAKERERKSIVRVRYVDLDQDARVNGEESGGYAFRWTLDVDPGIGQRVWIPGGDGRKAAGVVVGYGRASYRSALKDVIGIPTMEEQARGAAKAKARSAAEEKNMVAWLNMARRAAGLPTPGRARTTVPRGYPEIAPVEGDATASAANEYGRMWWKAKKLAAELGRDEAEVKAFTGFAYRWFAIRDRQKG